MDKRIQNTLQYDFEYESIPENRSVEIAGFELSVAGVRIKMSRRYSPFIYNVYLPTIALTMASFISFMIPPNIVPGRIGIIVTLFLMLINTGNSVRSKIPPTSGMTAIEIWLAGLTGIISMVLLEYAFILK